MYTSPEEDKVFVKLIDEARTQLHVLKTLRFADRTQLDSWRRRCFEAGKRLASNSHPPVSWLGSLEQTRDEVLAEIHRHPPNFKKRIKRLKEIHVAMVKLCDLFRDLESAYNSKQPPSECGPVPTNSYRVLGETSSYDELRGE
jgi:hypothetical protein